MIGAIIVPAACFFASAMQHAEAKPLRHLVYNIGVNVSTQTDELVTGESGEMPTASSDPQMDLISDPFQPNSS